jgi:hypothetical protein
MTIATGLAVAAPAANASGAERFALVGPEANILCKNMLPIENEPSQPGPGFVIFTSQHGVVSALIVLRGAAPNSSYPVRLLQPFPDDCFEVGGTIKTNGQGNGTLRLTEPDVGQFAQVIINSRDLFGLPTYRASQRYLTD